jgi:X-X-X-Leu-X-X-Gly heptad repeat protein
MRMRKDYKIGVALEGEDNASDEVAKVEGRLKGLGKSAKIGFLAVAAAAAGAVLAIKKVVTASAEQEESVKKLEVAAQRYGTAGAAVAAAAEKQAAALQGISKFGDEAIIAQQAVLIQMGVTAEKLPDATAAAVDLSEAMGISLESAARNVGKTMGGFAGELGELIPELKNLTAEELKAGKGIDLLREKFLGTAERTTSFSKTVSQLSNAWGDTLEKIGDAITQNADLSGTIQDVTKWLQANGEQIGEVSAKVIEFTTVALGGLIKAFKAVVDAGVKVIEFFEDWNEQIDDVQVSGAALQRSADRMGISVDELKERMAAAAERTRQLNAGFQETPAATGPAKTGIDGVTTSLKNLATAYQKAVEGTQALGTATSVQLEAQILKIQQELYNQGLILGDHTAEWQKMADDAGQQIEFLRKRIESLRGGLGDLTEETTGAKDATEALNPVLDEEGTAANTAADGVDRLADGTNRLSREQDRAATSARRLTQAQAAAAAYYRVPQGALGPGLANRTAQRQAEVDAALQAGYQPIMGGTRIRLPGGGSRLVGTRRF